MNDAFTTIRAEVRTETKVQGSRFFAAALPVMDKKGALDAVRREQKESFDATHHCYAYRLGVNRKEFRYHDDGEPAGTAGRPILAAIDREGLTDVLVIVTRYFGGTKLGTGGLTRAYGGTAEQVLAKAKRVTNYALAAIEVAFPHPLVSNVMHVVSRTGAKIADTAYDEEVHMTLEIRVSKLDELRAALIEQTSGNIRMT